jgi:hypothetical protein
MDAPLQQLSSLSAGFVTLGLWITLGLGIAFGALLLLWGHRLGKAASVTLGALCGVLLGALAGVAIAIFTGQSGPLFAFAGAVLGFAAGGALGWFLVRTTMVTIFGTIVGTIAASITWTLSASPAPAVPLTHAPVQQLTEHAPVELTEPAHDEMQRAQSDQATTAAADEPTAAASPIDKAPTAHASDTAQPAKRQAAKPQPEKHAAAKPARPIVGHAPKASTTSLESKVVEADGKRRIVIRSRSEVEEASAGSLAEGLSALASVAGKASGDAKPGPDLSALMNMARGGQPDPAQLQDMLTQLQSGGGAGGGLGGGLGSLAGLGGGLPGGLGGLAGGMPGGANMQELESQLAAAANAFADLVRRAVLAGLVGLVASTLASIVAAFVKKPLVPLTMSLTGAYCLAGAAEAGLGLLRVSPSPMLLEVLSLAIVVAATSLGVWYQLRAPLRVSTRVKKLNEEQAPTYSPLTRRMGGDLTEAGTLKPANRPVPADQPQAVDPLGPPSPASEAKPPASGETPPAPNRKAA